MKRLWFALAICVLLCGAVHARDYMGLQPGHSTRAKADRVFGHPVRVAPGGSEVDYDPADHGAERLVVRFDDRGILRSIHLYPTKTFPRQKMVNWLELEKPDRMQRNAEGALEEIYSEDGIILTFAPGSTDRVTQLTHFDATPPAVAAKSRRLAPAPAMAVPEPGRRNFLGVSVLPTDAGELLVLQVQMESPAAAAGLQVEDVLLRFGGRRFQPPASDPAILSQTVLSAPAGKPLPLVFRRYGKKMRGTVTLAALTDKERKARKALNQEQTDLAADCYRQAKKPYKAKKYRKAAALLEKAYALDARPRNHAISLGKVYRLLGRYQDAERILTLRKSFDKASIVHYSLGRVAMGQRQAAKAIGHFKASINTLPEDDDGHLDYLWLGIACLGNQQPADADRYLNRAAESRPKAEDPFYWLGRSAEMQARWRDARDYYERYLAMSPQNAERARDAGQRSQKMALAIKRNDPGHQAGRELGEALGDALKGIFSE